MFFQQNNHDHRMPGSLITVLMSLERLKRTSLRKPPCNMVRSKQNSHLIWLDTPYFIFNGRHTAVAIDFCFPIAWQDEHMAAVSCKNPGNDVLISHKAVHESQRSKGVDRYL